MTPSSFSPPAADPTSARRAPRVALEDFGDPRWWRGDWCASALARGLARGLARPGERLGGNSGGPGNSPDPTRSALAPRNDAPFPTRSSPDPCLESLLNPPGLARPVGGEPRRLSAPPARSASWFSNRLGTPCGSRSPPRPPGAPMAPSPRRARVVEAVVHGALAQRGDRLEVLPLLLAPLPRRLAVPDAPGLELHEELALVRLDLAPVEVDERVGEKGDVVAVLGIARERAPAHVQASELDAAKQRGLEVPRALDAALLEREDAQERQVLDRARVTQRRVAAGVEDAKRAPERGYPGRRTPALMIRGSASSSCSVVPLCGLGGDVEPLQGGASLEVVDDGEAVAVEVELGEGRASLEALYARDAVVLQVEVRQLRQALDPGEARDDVVVEVQDAHAGRDARDGLHVPADPAAVEVEVREPGEVRLDGLVEPAPGARALDAREHHLPRHVPPVARVSPVARVPPVARVGRRVHPGRGPPARGDAEEDPDRARAREVGREAHVERPRRC